jgi:hypothetical protein
MMIDELIKRDHDEIADLFDHLVVMSRDDRRADEAARIAVRLVALVRLHSAAEEKVVYELLRHASPALKAFALAGPHEHENLDTTLEKLLVRHPGDEEYVVIVKVGRDLFEMHARDEEEADILPQMREVFSEDTRRALAAAMLAEQARIRPQVLRHVGMPARAA